LPVRAAERDPPRLANALLRAGDQNDGRPLRSRPAVSVSGDDLVPREPCRVK
jgi:hypothetical protein